MSKRKVNFDDNVEEFSDEDKAPEDSKQKKVRVFDGKYSHTLDSDEDDDEVIADTYNVLDVQEIAGEEDPTINYDGDIRITPFNMKDELEEGHFDKEGTFIFNKDNEERDSWLDNIDSIPVMHEFNINRAQQQTDEEIDIDLNECYRDMLTLMNPSETAKKAIQRYGKICHQNQSKSKRRKKSDDKSIEFDNNTDNTAEHISLAKENLLKLSSLADKVLNAGDVDIYEKTFEQLQLFLNKKSGEGSVETDMFSDNFEETSNSVNDNNEVLWEFKWQNTNDAKIYGSYNSSHMLSWVNDGYFKDGVYVRQVGKKDSQFYNSERIDFELYI